MNTFTSSIVAVTVHFLVSLLITAKKSYFSQKSVPFFSLTKGQKGSALGFPFSGSIKCGNTIRKTGQP